MPAALTLDNVTALYRYAALAPALGLPVSSFLSLKTLAGAARNPVKTPANPASGPDTTLAFVTLAQAVQNSGFTVAQLDYLYRHISAPPTGLAPDDTTLQVLAIALRDGLAQIIAANQQAPDPTGALTQAKLTQLVSKDLADQTVAMISGTAAYAAPLAVAALPGSIAATNAGNQVTGIDPAKLPADVTMKLSYDPAGRTLSFTGAMTTAQLAELSQLRRGQRRLPGRARLLYAQPASFISDSLGGPAGILGAADAASLLQLLRANPALDGQLKPVYLDQQGDPVPPSGNAARDHRRGRELRLPARHPAALPDQPAQPHAGQADRRRHLRPRSRDDQPAAGGHPAARRPTPASPVIADLLALAGSGLTAAYTSPVLAPPRPPSVPSPSTAPTQRCRPGTTEATFSARLEPPATADVTFSVQTNGTPQLLVAGASVTLSQQPDGSYASAPVSLTAGQLVPIALQLTGLPAAGAAAMLSWQSATQPKAAVPGDEPAAAGRLRQLPAGLYPHPEGGAARRPVRADRARDQLPDQRDHGRLRRIQPERPPAGRRRRLGRAVGRSFRLLAAPAGLCHAPRWPARRAARPPWSMSSPHRAPRRPQTLLPQATGWDPQVVGDLFTAFGLAAGPANPIIDDTWLTTLQACVGLAQLVGADVGHLTSWARPDLSFGDLDDAAGADQAGRPLPLRPRHLAHRGQTAQRRDPRQPAGRARRLHHGRRGLHRPGQPVRAAAHRPRDGHLHAHLADQPGHQLGPALRPAVPARPRGTIRRPGGERQPVGHRPHVLVLGQPVLGVGARTSRCSCGPRTGYPEPARRHDADLRGFRRPSSCRTASPATPRRPPS